MDRRSLLMGYNSRASRLLQINVYEETDHDLFENAPKDTINHSVSPVNQMI